MKKFAATVMILTAGSIFCNNIPASARGMELERIDITFRRNNDCERYGRYERYERYERRDHCEMRHRETPPPRAHHESRGYRRVEHVPHPHHPPHHPHHHHRGRR